MASSNQVANTYTVHRTARPLRPIAADSIVIGSTAAAVGRDLARGDLGRCRAAEDRLLLS